MTFAICAACGARKVGALTSCLNCNQYPNTKAKVDEALLLSDHFLSIHALNRIGRKIESKEKVELLPYFLPFHKYLIYLALRYVGAERLERRIFENFKPAPLDKRSKY